MWKILAGLGLLLLSACRPLPIQNDPASSDFYGMELGLVRTYKARFPLCGKPHDHLMRKSVQKPLRLEDGRAVVIEVEFAKTFELELHGMPGYSREVFTENGNGFGYYDLKPGEDPVEAAAKQIEIEVPKPVQPGTRLKSSEGEVILETIEDVTVAAGRFGGCIRVRTQFPNDANVFWFAPGVGMVRGYSESKGKDGRAAMEFELVELTRAAAH